MADVSIDSSIGTATARGMRSVVFTTADIGYWFYVDSSGAFVYSKTTDGGATWGAAVTIGAATTHVAFDVWFDQWTPGDSGTRIHLWYFDVTNDDVFWRSLDTNGDTFGTQRVVYAGASSVAGRGAFVSGTKCRDVSGQKTLYCAFDIDAGAERGLFKSGDAGTNWGTNLSTTFVEATLDEAQLFPASNTGDDNDCWCVYKDTSALAMTLKMWDYSANSATESATIQTIVNTGQATDLTGQFGYSASVRHSDGHLILASISDRDTATSDHQVWDINGIGSITALTNITTNIDDHWHPSVFIDQTTDDIYVAYNGKRDGSETLTTNSKVYYTKSTDGGANWSAGDTAYMEGLAATLQTWAPLMGPRFYVGWRANAIIGNKVNSVTFSAAAADLQGNAAAEAAAAGALTTQIPIAGAALVVGTATGALTTPIPLAGAAAAVAVASGGLTVQIRLSVAAVMSALSTGGLSTQIVLAAAAQAQATMSGALSTGIPLAGAAGAAALAQAQITTQIRLDGPAVARALAAGGLSTGVALAGGAAASAQAAGALTTQIPLAGNAGATIAMSGDLSVGGGLAGGADAVASATGALGTEIILSGAAAAVTRAEGALSVEIRLSAAAFVAALAQAALVSGINLAGAAAAAALAGAALMTEIPLAGAALAQVAASGTLTNFGPLRRDARFVAVSLARSFAASPLARAFSCACPRRAFRALSPARAFAAGAVKRNFKAA